jgi:regulator of RNase E activity RraA
LIRKEKTMEIKDRNQPPRELVEGFRAVGTSTLGDILDGMGLQGVICGLRALKDGTGLVGPAVTVKEVSGVLGTYGTEDFAIGKVIDYAKPGDVLVFDNGGKEISTWGGLASTAAKIKGIEGVVIDGGCRDADQIVGLDFPVFSRHITPTTGKTRIKILEVNGIVQCGGIRISPGDIIVADQTGIIVVPQDKARDILEKAEEAEKAEEHFVEELKKGKTFSEIQEGTGRL